MLRRISSRLLQQQQQKQRPVTAARNKAGEPIVLYHASATDKIATITLNRAECCNAIIDETPAELEAAVRRANDDDGVNVIVLRGAPLSRGFCSGYDLARYAELPGENPGFQHPPVDLAKDFANMRQCTSAWMSLHHSKKPTIAAIHGAAVGGGSDIALCCDVVFASECASIGYPPSVLWGVATTAMWAHRIGVEKAKALAFTGRVLSGAEAASPRWGLIYESVPLARLEEHVATFAAQVARVPANQTQMNKLVLNQTLHAAGLLQTQTLATLLDGVARHTPEGVGFKKTAEDKGWKEAVKERDAMIFGGDK